MVDCRVSSFLHNGRWDVRKFLEWWPDFPLQKLNQVILSLHGGRDRLVWKRESSGAFSLTSTYSLVCPPAMSSFMDTKIWHSCVPMKTSFFMANLLRSRISLDLILCKFQIFGPFVCGC